MEPMVRAIPGCVAVVALLATSAMASAGPGSWHVLSGEHEQAKIPTPLGVYRDAPRGSVLWLRREHGKRTDGAWAIPTPGGTLSVVAAHRIEHANGDVTSVGHLAGSGARYPVLWTEGREASFATGWSPAGPFRFEARGEIGVIVDLSHPAIRLEGAGASPIPPSGFVPPSPPAKGKNLVVVDVAVLYSQGIEERYPGSAVETRINHLVALANQALATSAVPVVLRLVDTRPSAYPDNLGPNADALDALRQGLANPSGHPNVGNLRQYAQQTGADLITLLRPHDIETRGNCGIAYLFANDGTRGVNVVSDGFSSWSLCADEVYAHEVGHNFGAEHQLGQTSANPGYGTALAREGQFHTVMGSFGSGHPDRYRRLLRFSNPDQFCGGMRCGIPNVADNARRLRDNMQAIANFRASVSMRPVPTPPPPLDPDEDGDGVPESQDAFPFDWRYARDGDEDGIPDPLDDFPEDRQHDRDTDRDGMPDGLDPDIDGDGVANEQDAFPYDRSESRDGDSDGVGDNADRFPNDPREWRDTDGDGVGDHADPDRDGDGVPDFAAGVEAGEFDLLVIDTARDRVLRFDLASGLFSGIEFAEWHLPQALGQQAQLAWNPHQKLLYALVAGEIRRYERAARSRHDRFVTTYRHPRDPGPKMPSSFSAGLALAPDGTIFLADESTRRLERRDAITGRPAPLGAFGQADFLAAAPRSIRFRDGRVWSLDRNGRLRAVDAASGQIVFDQALGTIGGFPVSQPEDLELSRDGRFVFIADTLQHRIVRIETQPPFNRSVHVLPGGGGLLFLPSGLLLDRDGHLLVASRETGAILRYHGESGAFLGRFDRAPPGLMREPRRMLLAPKVRDRFPLDRERAFRPVSGGWYNPARSGHGFAIEVAGPVLLAIWYSYRSDGEPTWYLAQGELRGSRFEAPLLRYRWLNGAAVGQAVGQLRIDFASERQAVFSWQLPDSQGSEPLVPLAVGSAEETQFPTAAWYDPRESGWGLIVARQGERAYVIAFLYDRAGEPTWALGTADAGASFSFRMDYFRAPGLCPGCPGGTAIPQPAGHIEFRPLDRNRAQVQVAVAAAVLDWSRGPLDLERLTESPTEPNLDPKPAEPLAPVYGFPPR
ncbi:MAG: hypothetical protein KatS3mg125_1067 [Lysobacterales bacterium]|nr:MAG: hypothetical protein KatS3mg125_1067 [Xanthomonadales bacterium]